MNIFALNFQKQFEDMIKPLTSLRLFFALMVFGAHCYIIDPLFNHAFFKEGFVGVNFFFILSGFIISYNYQKKITEKKTSLREFWVARIARIYPLHWLTLFMSAAIGGYVAVGAIDWIKHFAANLLLVQPFVPKMDYFFSFNSPSWSLGCEQLFYFLFPFLASLFVKSKRLTQTLIVITALMLLGMTLTHEDNIRAYWYVNPLTRLPDFLIGMLLFRLYDKYKAIEWSARRATFYEISVIVLFFAFCIFGYEFIPKVYRYSVYYWIPICLLLFTFAKQSGLISRILSNKYLIIGGDISFGFYLIHLFIMEGYLKMNSDYGLDIPYFINIPIMFIIITGLSYLTYRFFEKPAGRFVKRTLNIKKQ